MYTVCKLTVTKFLGGKKTKKKEKKNERKKFGTTRATNSYTRIYRNIVSRATVQIYGMYEIRINSVPTFFFSPPPPFLFYNKRNVPYVWYFFFLLSLRFAFFLRILLHFSLVAPAVPFLFFGPIVLRIRGYIYVSTLYPFFITR